MKIFTGDIEKDNIIMTEYLDNVEFYSGTDRKKMLSVSKGNGSMLYGFTWRSWLSPTKSRTYHPLVGLYSTKVYDLHPELKDVFKEYSQIYFPDFQYLNVQMNKNFPCPEHKDSTNVGDSVLCGFGDYKGGLTGIEFEPNVREFYDIKKKHLRFNGAEYLHWVSPIESGTRYSLVFFNNTSLLRRSVKNKYNKDLEERYLEE